MIRGFIEEEIGAKVSSVLLKFTRRMIGKKYDHRVLGLREQANSLNHVKSVPVFQL